MIIRPLLNGINASSGTHVVDPLEIVLAGDAPSPAHDGEADL